MKQSEQGSPAGTVNGAADRLHRALVRGTEALAHGDVVAAQECAREALALRPGHPQAKNLMALAFYHDGAYELACDVFDGLARRKGDAVALRVNAGLAALKSKRNDLALAHLQRAIDLDPTHRRAFGYLAVLHLETGDIELARAALQESGLDSFAKQALAERSTEIPAVEQLWQAIAGVPALTQVGGEGHEAFVEIDPLWQPPPVRADRHPQQASAGVVEAPTAGDDPIGVPADVAPSSKVEGSPTTETPVTVGATDTERPGTGVTVTETNRGSAGQTTAADIEPAPLTSRPTLDPVGAAPAPTDQPELGSLSEATVGPLRDPAMLLRDGWLHVGVGGRSTVAADVPGHGGGVVARSDVLWAVQGDIAFDKAQRRVRAEPAGAFEVGNAAFWRVTGHGEMLLCPPEDTTLALIELPSSDSVVYLRENALVAFSGQLHWENGRLPQGDCAVRLAGRGAAAVAHPGRIKRLVVSPGQPVLARGQALCGWYGDIVVGSASVPLGAGSQLYQCSGTGYAVLVVERSAR